MDNHILIINSPNLLSYKRHFVPEECISFVISALLRNITETDLLSVMATLVQDGSKKELTEKVQIIDRKFQHVCHQLHLINDCIVRTQCRYDRSEKNGNKSLRYSLRIKLCALEGARNMFYEYALRMADQLDKMRHQLGYIIEYPSDQYEDEEDLDGEENDDYESDMETGGN